MAATLTQLRAHADSVRAAINELTENPSVTVTIDGMTLTRPAMSTLRREYNATIAEINRRESGGVAPFDRSIRFVDDGESD